MADQVRSREPQAKAPPKGVSAQPRRILAPQPVRRRGSDVHTRDVEQLDLFAPEQDTHEPHPGGYDEPQAERVYQLTELPGTTFEDIFAGPPSRTRNAA